MLVELIMTKTIEPIFVAIVLYTIIFERGITIFYGVYFAYQLQVLRGWITPKLPLSRSHSLQSVKT